MADPLAIIQTVVSVSKQLYSIVKSIQGAPAELKALEYEISRVHFISEQLIGALTSLGDNTEMRRTAEPLQCLFNEAREVVEAAKAFSSKVVRTTPSHGALRVNKLKWIRESASCKALSDQFQNLYTSISAVHSVISTQLLLYNNRQLDQSRAEFNDGFQSVTDHLHIHLSALRELHNDIRESRSDTMTMMREVGAHLSRHIQHSPPMTCICHTLVCSRMQSDEDSQRLRQELGQHYDRSTTELNTVPPFSPPSGSAYCYNHTIASPPSNSAGDRCPPHCCCRCHRPPIPKLPQWLYSLIGTLSIQHDWLTSLAAARVQCTEQGCKRYRSDLLQIKYRCPMWFAQINAEIRTVAIPVHFCIQTPRVVHSLFWLWEATYDEVRQKLHNRELTVNDVESGGYSAIHAITSRVVSNPSNHALQILSLLLEQSAPLEWQWDGLTPVENALRILFCNWRRYDSRAAAITALKSYLHPCLTQSIEEVWEDMGDKLYWTPLHRRAFALSTKSSAATSFASVPPHLISQVNVEDPLGWTPLFYAMLDDPEQMDALLKAGADPTIDLQILVWAARSGADMAIGRLVRAGAYDSLGKTALHQVADPDTDRCLNAFAVALALVRHTGHIAHWDAQDSDGATPLDYAWTRVEEHPSDGDSKRILQLYSTRSLPDGAQYISSQKLAANGLAIEDDASGLPPTSLIRAALRGEIESIGRLIQLDAMVNERDQHGLTLLHLVALGQVLNGYRVALELVRHGGWGVDWDAVEPVDGKTALQIVTARIEIGGLEEVDRQEAENIQKLLRAQRLPSGEQYLWPCMDPDFYEREPCMPGAWVNP